MADLTFVTGNEDKYKIALELFGAAGVPLRQAKLDIDEIQSEDVVLIATTKAKTAYQILHSPMIIRDDSWAIPGLRGFPGPYMKSINHWFTTNDFLNLTRPLDDRRATLTQTLVYMDGSITKVMQHETTGELLRDAKGSSPVPFENITSLEGDNGKTVAEVLEEEQSNLNRAPAAVWHDFIAWYKDNQHDNS